MPSKGRCVKVGSQGEMEVRHNSFVVVGKRVGIERTRFNGHFEQFRLFEFQIFQGEASLTLL